MRVERIDEYRWRVPREDRKSTRLNSSHSQISYAVFCLKKKTTEIESAPAVSAPHRGAFLWRGRYDVSRRKGLLACPFSTSTRNVAAICLHVAIVFIRLQ